MKNWKSSYLLGFWKIDKKVEFSTSTKRLSPLVSEKKILSPQPKIEKGVNLLLGQIQGFKLPPPFTWKIHNLFIFVEPLPLVSN